MKSLRKNASSDGQRSLFGEILDWMLAPLLFVWPISIAVTHFFANNVAGFPYDQTLREHVTAISRQIKFVDGRPQITLAGSVRIILRSDEIDNVYFHVLGAGGKLLVGDKELPAPGPAQLTQRDEPGELYFRDAEYNGQDLRLAYMYMAEPTARVSRWLSSSSRLRYLSSVARA